MTKPFRPSYFFCFLCGKDMQELKAGDVCYLISKQTTSKEDASKSGHDLTVFKRTAVGFRFCEQCWFDTAGMKYKIEL